MIRTFFRCLFALALAGPLALLAAVHGPVSGERAWTTESAAPAPRLRLAAKAASASLRLAPVGESELEALRASRRGTQTKRLQIGVARGLEGAEGVVPSSGNLAWTATEGGMAARFSVTSPGAAAMRLALDLASAPPEAELLFSGSAGAGRLLGPVRVGALADRASPWWSPVTEGETQSVEIFVPGSREPGAAGFELRQASHLVVTPVESLGKVALKIGESGSCNVDSNCVSNPSQAYINARNSVARMVVTVGGSSFLCTGTLLNDSDAATQTPWFFTANHCFESGSTPASPAQLQAAANTLNTFWFYESASCGSSTLSSAMVQRSGGALFVYGNLQTDVMFLRLNEAAPAGSFFSGWDPGLVTAGANAICVHHPSGDLKKFSQGTIRGYASYSSSYAANGFIEMRWTDGITEGGSSGSGLWTFGGSEYFLRGGLLGGAVGGCATPNDPDFYSRLDLAFPALAPYLSTTATPFADFTDLWWNPNESGWGLNLIQHASNNIFGVWYTYGSDGKRQWIVMPGGSWIASNAFVGTLYVTSGPAYSGAFNPALVKANPVGTGSLTFTGTGSGTWSYTVNGVAGSRTIQRQPF